LWVPSLIRKRILLPELGAEFQGRKRVKKPSTMLIVEDQTILRESLKAFLSSQPDLQVIGEAGDGFEAIRSVQKHTPDLVLLDLSMPIVSGLDAIKEIRRVSPKTKIVVLTVHSTEEYILSALEAGAVGYVLKDAHSAELLAAIRHVLDGRHYLSPSISDTIIDGFLKGKKTPAARSAWEKMTQREREVLKLVAEGHKNREIADLLCISIKTVEKHRVSLMKKLGMKNVAALTALAIEKGLINQ
jgi:DNA-binding NarL/FixJ family response regulator